VDTQYYNVKSEIARDVKATRELRGYCEDDPATAARMRRREIRLLCRYAELMQRQRPGTLTRREIEADASTILAGGCA